MIPTIPSIVEMLRANECTAQQAIAWINAHIEDSDLRDHFAGMAMQALIAKGMEEYAKRGMHGVPLIPKYAYEYADAMIKERSK